MNNQKLTTAFQHNLETNKQWYEIINYDGFSVDGIKYSTEEEAIQRIQNIKTASNKQ